MDSQSLQYTTHLACGFLPKFRSDVFVLKAMDIVLTTCNGQEYLLVCIVEEVKSFIRMIFFQLWSSWRKFFLWMYSMVRLFLPAIFLACAINASRNDWANCG